MIPNIHQSIDEIIKNANSEEKIIWQQIRLITGENAAIRQLIYQGGTAGSEFTAAASNNRMYLANRLRVGDLNAGAASSSAGFCQLNNQAGNAIFMLTNNQPLWQVTAAAIYYSRNTIDISSAYFWNLTIPANYTYLYFNGYRITY